MLTLPSSSALFLSTNLAKTEKDNFLYTGWSCRSGSHTSRRSKVCSVFLEGNSATFYEVTGRCSYHSPVLPSQEFNQTAARMLHPRDPDPGLYGSGQEAVSVWQTPFPHPTLAVVPHERRPHLCFVDPRLALDNGCVPWDVGRSDRCSGCHQWSRRGSVIPTVPATTLRSNTSGGHRSFVRVSGTRGETPRSRHEPAHSPE